MATYQSLNNYQGQSPHPHGGMQYGSQTGDTGGCGNMSRFQSAPSTDTCMYGGGSAAIIGQLPQQPDEVFASAQQLLGAVANEVMRLERSGAAVTMSDVDKVDLRLDQCKSMLSEVTSSSSSAIVRQRAVQQLQEAQSLEEALGRLRRKVSQTDVRTSERQSLLGDKVNRNGMGNVTDLAHLKNERESLVHSANKLRNLVSESHAILGALKTQGNTLEGTQNKLAVDFLESIGVSNHTLLQIARTTKLDALIVYIGIILTCVLMLYILFK